MDYPFRLRYETLRSLLNKNGEALQIMSDLEADLNHMHHYDERIKHPIRKLFTESLLMAQELNLLTKNRYSDLYEKIFWLRNETDLLFKKEQTLRNYPLVLMMDSLESPDPTLIGGKASSVWLLGKHFTNLVPAGFVVTTTAYNRILDEDNLHHRIRLLLNNLDVTTDQDQFRSRTRTIRQWIREATVPEEIEHAIQKHAERIMKASRNATWAVRSSAVCEDGTYSFAGQFDTELQIKTENLVSAYKNVLASRFSDRAVTYRMHTGFSEVDTPMAVLFMPMINPVASGVAYTSDMEHPDSNSMVINAVPGLSNKMIRGEVKADTFVISKKPHPKLQKIVPASDDSKTDSAETYIRKDKLLEIADIAIKASDLFGYDLDIEWALDADEKIHLLQARQLNIAYSEKEASVGRLSKKKDTLPILEGGITIFPGRAEGPVWFIEDKSAASSVPTGVIAVVEKPRPELAVILPKIAALLVMEGNPAGHLATLVREFSIPCIFRIGKNAKILLGKNVISINATKRTIYSGIRWPGIRERVLARIAAKDRHKKSGPLYDLVLRLNLIDPDKPSFRPKSCKSIHDTLRFMHEMSVRSMFGFGDEHKRGWNKKSRELQTGLPIKFQMIDLDQSAPVEMKKVKPEDVASRPFKALWRGISDKRISWPDRWKNEMAGLPSDFRETVLSLKKGPRRPSDRNYLIVAKDYINLNARFAYHYAMVDAMIGPGTENNHVHFRFRGGGASDKNRIRRARFLVSVLRDSGFGVDQQGDLVTAWYRGYPQNDSENSLETLGRLMVCARQLDAALKNDTDIKLYSTYFLEGKYSIFS